MPFGVLVVLVLGAIAVDLSLVHLAEREAHAAASAAVNDAVGAGLDVDALYTSGGYRLDPARVHSVVTTSLAAQEHSGRRLHLAAGPHLSDRDGDGNADTVTVTVRVDVDYLFAAAVPGAPAGTSVEASATATAHRG